jgi:hypothetical protein
MASLPHPFMEEWEKRGISIAIVMFNPAASEEFRGEVLKALPMKVGCLNAYDVWTVTK